MGPKSVPKFSTILELSLKDLWESLLDFWFTSRMQEHFWDYPIFSGWSQEKSFENFFHDFFRFLDGVADAAAWGAGVSILMKLFPNKVSTIMSWTEMLFGLGYMLGKIIENFFFEMSKQ